MVISFLYTQNKYLVVFLTLTSILGILRLHLSSNVISKHYSRSQKSCNKHRQQLETTINLLCANQKERQRQAK